MKARFAINGNASPLKTKLGSIKMKKTITLDRRELCQYLRWQFDHFNKPEGNCHHYGKYELKDLLDKLFGGPPECPEDEFDYDHNITWKKEKEERLLKQEEALKARQARLDEDHKLTLELLRKQADIKCKDATSA